MLAEFGRRKPTHTRAAMRCLSTMSSLVEAEQAFESAPHGMLKLDSSAPHRCTGRKALDLPRTVTR